MRRTAFIIIISFFVMVSLAQGEDDPITKLKDETMLYFTPVNGTVAEVEGSKVRMTIDRKGQVRPGMRLKVLREGKPFIHPVTKELLGRVESTIGKVEITGVNPESSSGIMIEGEAKEGDKVRISETKIKVLFCQEKNVDWYLADEYYRKLKATERIEMIDTALETADEKKLLEEAGKKGAEVVLLLTAKEAEKGTLLRQQLFWVSDGSRFVDLNAKVDIAFAKELKFGEEFFSPRSGEAMLMFDLPFGARFVSTGDFDGDGKQEIVLSTGKDSRFFIPAVDLQYLWEIKGSATDDHIWIDSADLNKNGKDEFIVTSMSSGQVVSYIYELEGTEFRKLWEGKYFLRKVGAGLIGQSYTKSDGFDKDVFEITWNGEYKTGEKVKLPGGVNLYDFVYIEGAEKEALIFAYDEKGFLNLFNEKGIRTWRSRTDTGGFLTTFKREVPATYMDKGEWSVKDRLITRYKEVLVIDRVPFVEMAKGIGYKSSRIKNYWWNGFSMEEGILINDIKGSVLDYALAGDKMLVLTSPFLGIKFGNILKGENPLGTVLYIYSVKGR
ncbi:MAG: VCBS repeat-containing protein [Nitrospirota bacterium]